MWLHYWLYLWLSECVLWDWLGLYLGLGGLSYGLGLRGLSWLLVGLARIRVYVENIVDDVNSVFISARIISSCGRLGFLFGFRLRNNIRYDTRSLGFLSGFRKFFNLALEWLLVLGCRSTRLVIVSISLARNIGNIFRASCSTSTVFILV